MIVSPTRSGMASSGARFRQEFVAAVNLADGGVARDDQASLLRYLTDHAQAADAQPVSATQKLATRFARTGAQHRVAPVVVDQENLCVIDVRETLDDQIDDAIQQSLQVALRRGVAADVLRRADVARARRHARFQVCHQRAYLVAHVDERGRQRPISSPRCASRTSTSKLPSESACVASRSRLIAAARSVG